MSKKSRRRPSWKAWKKGPEMLVINLISEETGEVWEVIRIPKNGRVASYLREFTRRYGTDYTGEFIKEVLIHHSEYILENNK